MFNQPIILKPSYLLTIFLLLIHLGAAIIVISLSFAWFVIVPTIILLIVNLIKNICRYALQLSNHAIVEIWPKENNEWLLKNKQGTLLQTHLMPASYYSVNLVVLNFRLNDKKRKLSVIILPDNITKNSFRCLRAQLFILRQSI